MEETHVKITPREARDCFQKPESYIEKAENTPATIFKAIVEINNFLDKRPPENTKLNKQRLKISIHNEKC